MTDSVKLAAEAAAHEAAERFDTGTRERPLPMNAARQSAFVSGAAWQRQQDESEAMKVAAQRAVRIRELEARLDKILAELLEPVRLGSNVMREWDTRIVRCLAILDGDGDE